MNLEDLLKDKKDKNFVGYVSACESGEMRLTLFFHPNEMIDIDVKDNEIIVSQSIETENSMKSFLCSGE